MKVMSWKTYAVAVCLGLATVAKALGYVDENAYLTIMGFLNAAGLGALRAGVTKSGPPTLEKISPPNN